MEKIGLKLKLKREAKGLTFNDINAAIRTPLKYLAALEDDDISVFPAEVYYLGSLRRYATHIGLDADELIDAYRQNKIIVEQETLPKKQERSGKSSTKLWTALLIVILAVISVVIIWFNLKVSESPSVVPVTQAPVQQPAKQETEKTSAPVSQPKAAKHTEQAKVENKPVEAREETSQAAVEDNNKRYNLAVEAVSNCWIKVTIDGNTVFAATLEKGSKKHWSADNELGLVVGYVPGLRVQLNGKSIDITSGAKQDVNELHFKAEDEQQAR
jgi:cytoskeleton protein RodZ